MRFYKYYASGNDFLIFKSQRKDDESLLAKRLCNRYSGIGADGFIKISEHKDCDFAWDFYNCDGSKAAMCGNGARAAASFAHHILKKPAKLSFLTKASKIKACIKDDEVELDMGEPKVLAKDLKLYFKNSKEITSPTKAELCLKAGLIDSGVRHLVLLDKSCDSFDLLDLAELRLKYDANVNIASIKDGVLYVRTFERGVEGETLACGTGMMACFYFAYLNKLLAKSCKVYPKSNEELKARIENNHLFFKGKVRLCFETDIDN